MNSTTTSRLCTTSLTSDEISVCGCHWNFRVVSMSSDCPRSKFCLFLCACRGGIGGGFLAPAGMKGVPNPIAGFTQSDVIETCQRVSTRLTPTIPPWVLSSLIMKRFVHLKNSAQQQKVITVIRAIVPESFYRCKFITITGAASTRRCSHICHVQIGHERFPNACSLLGTMYWIPSQSSFTGADCHFGGPGA
jgi:hypothetical protein